MILALDIALHTGWALNKGTAIRTGTEGFHAHQYDCAVLGRVFKDWLCDMITENRPKVIAIERPFFRGAGSWHLSGMVWEAHRAAEMHKIPRFEYAPTSIKKFITGKGTAKKQDVMNCIRDRGYTFGSDHEADAISILLFHKSKGAA
jgi:Holliday junction resolvasome RuvABC endonuclease subunit